MISGSAALYWLLMGAAATPTMDLAARDFATRDFAKSDLAETELARYAPAATRFASATLLFDGRTNSVTILNQDNVAIKVIPAEYQDLQISRSFAIECVFPNSYPIKIIDTRADSRYHLIPVSVLEYKDFNPSYIKLEINTSYFANRTDNWDPNSHKVYIGFYSR
jgi:hypothetical protein